MKVRIAGREKTLYSIYRKMDEKHLSFAQVTDIYGFRVIVPTVTDCYTALGLLHQMYKPVPGKFKDHIAIPKVNGYQSLHTTLVGPSGVNVEFQMRTEAMHVVAESGVAAHWLYKAQRARRRRAPSGWAPSGCSRCSTSRTRRATPPSSGTTSRSTCSPTRSTCSRPRARSWRCRAARRWSTSPTRSTATSATAPSAATHQRRAGAAAHRAEERRRGRGGHGAGVHAQPGLAGLRAHRPRALQDPPPPQDAGAGRVAGSWARSCWRRRCAPRAWSKLPADDEEHHAALGQAAALHRQPQPRRTADRHRPGQAHRQHRRQAADDAAGRARREARCAAAQPRALHGARERVAGRGHAGRQRERLGAVRHLLPAGAGRRDRRLPGPRRGPGGAHRRLRRRPSACSTRTASASSASNGPTSRCAPSRPACWSRCATARACWRAWPRRWPTPKPTSPTWTWTTRRAQDATDLRFVIAVRDRAHLDAVLRNAQAHALGAARAARTSRRQLSSASAAGAG